MKNVLSFTGAAAFIIATFAFIVAVAGGWVLNLIKLVNLTLNFGHDYLVELLIRLVGVPLVVLGAVLGWF